MAINYPYRVFRYQVEIDGISRAGFSEVSGMSSSVDAVEYREGDDLRTPPQAGRPDQVWQRDAALGHL